ncbi:MAG TPA: Gfo/Idh/MocA family protein [Candidatus Wunengus sp. YC60]|uniref:Gfo/Idh/MocA family protein n=1 Tax=Candidatus Wunengus sp. YC60 TaxID=3367697 RepID=UPI004027AC06
MIKILLLGVGRWGSNHLRVLHSLPVDLYVADVNAEHLALAGKLGISNTHLSANPHEFSNIVDAVVIVTPAQTHFDLCKMYMEAGKDVFVEKPITLLSSEAKILAELSERKKRILQVGHIFRFDPASLWLCDSIQQNKFGQVKILRANFSGFKRPRNDTGVTFADSIHFIDLFNYFMGVPPVRVTAVLKDFMGRGMEDVSFIAMDYERADGLTLATVESGYYTPGKFREVVVIGEELSAVCDYNVSQYKIKTFENKHVKTGKEIKTVEGAMRQLEFAPEEPLLAELRAFIDSAQTRKPPIADGWAGYEVVRVVEAALDSAKNGRTIELSK